jgi:RNA polymerase sigma-70 factor (ECF subfamily)
MNSLSTPSAGSTSASLIGRIRRHDPEAWRRLVQSYGPLVYGWGRQAGLQSSDAADVMQETFRSVAKSIEAFERNSPGDSFRGWLWTITKNKIRDHFRRVEKRREAQGTNLELLLQQIPELPPDDPTATGTIDGASVRLVRAAVDEVRGEFEPRTWQAFWRVTVEGQTAAEAADGLGMSVGALYVAKSRVLRRLREELSGLFEDDPSS